jgi:signal peptidase I
MLMEKANRRNAKNTANSKQNARRWKMPKINSKYFSSSDVKDGDIITFYDGGKLVEKKWGTVIEITIKLPDDTICIYSLKGKNYRVCSEVFGSKDTNDWIGRQAKIKLFPNQLVAGKTTTIVMLEPIGEMVI